MSLLTLLKNLDFVCVRARVCVCIEVSSNIVEAWKGELQHICSTHGRVISSVIKTLFSMKDFIAFSNAVVDTNHYSILMYPIYNCNLF